MAYILADDWRQNVYRRVRVIAPVPAKNSQAIDFYPWKSLSFKSPYMMNIISPRAYVL